MDEADRMFDMGFEPQIDRILFDFNLPEKTNRQNLLFSATFDDKVRQMTKKFLNNDNYYITNNSGTGLRVNDKVKHHFYKINDDYSKLNKLIELLKDIDGSVLSKIVIYIIIINLISFILFKIIVFRNTKHNVSRLSDFLYDSGYKNESIHGDKEQAQRKVIKIT